MLSKQSGKLFKIVIRWCNVCGGMPFIWNGRRGKVCITKKGQIRWGSAFLIQLGLCIYTYFRLFQMVTALHQQFEISPVKFDAEVSYCFVHALIHTFMVALSVNTILNQKELVLFTNSYLKFTSHFREAYIAKLCRTWTNGCEDLVQIMITFAISSPLIPTIHFLFNPCHPIYLPYYLVSYSNGGANAITALTIRHDDGLLFIASKFGLISTILLIGGFAVFQIIFIWIITSTILFITVNVTISAFVFKSAIREMTIFSPEGMPYRRRGKARQSQYLIPIYVTKDKLRTCTSLVRCYRSFQIVETLSHHCFSGLAFWVEVLQILFISLIMFVLLKFLQGISSASIIILVLVIILSCSLWTFILSIVGRFKSTTELCCQSWKFVKINYVDELRYMKVVKRSCHPIKIWAGNNIFEMKIKHVPVFLYITTVSIIAWNALYRNYFFK